MNREEQIRNANPYSGSSDIGFGKMCGFERGAEWADNNPVSSPWISVVERLPEEHKEVLARYNVCAETKYDVLFIYGSTSWCFADMEEYIDESMTVTHWMPIPE